MTLKDLEKKTIAILGFGVEGIALAQYFLKHNIAFSVIDEKSLHELEKTGADEQNILQKLQAQKIPLLLGKQIDAETLHAFAVLFRSPGISLHKAYLQNFPGEITSVTKFFFDNFPGKIIGVTGTKGKGTTATLIYEMLKKAGMDVYLGGNIGAPPIAFLDILSQTSLVVLELSSFQLQDIQKSPHVAVMLMVTQEHLQDFRGQNFHASKEEYHEAKRNILRFQTSDDMAILSSDYAVTKASAAFTKGKIAFVSRFQPVDGCFVEDNEIVIRWNQQEERVISIFDILLPGKHNLENVCAAVMAVYSLGVSVADIAFVLKTFKGLAHRLELVREVAGVRYYDDSFSTVPETAIAAIEAFADPEILILGGSSKNSDFTGLGKVISEAKNIKAIIGIGMEWPSIQATIANKNIPILTGAKNMSEIIAAVQKVAKAGDVVLLSPACASFDMFLNYKERGNLFKEAVNLL